MGSSKSIQSHDQKESRSTSRSTMYLWTYEPKRDRLCRRFAGCRQHEVVDLCASPQEELVLPPGTKLCRYYGLAYNMLLSECRDHRTTTSKDVDVALKEHWVNHRKKPFLGDQLRQRIFCSANYAPMFGRKYVYVWVEVPLDPEFDSFSTQRTSGSSRREAAAPEDPARPRPAVELEKLLREEQEAPSRCCSVGAWLAELFSPSVATETETGTESSSQHTSIDKNSRPVKESSRFVLPATATDAEIAAFVKRC